MSYRLFKKTSHSRWKIRQKSNERRQFGREYGISIVQSDAEHDARVISPPASIREVPISYLDSETVYPDWGLFVIFVSPSRQMWG
jgi:hypothetical protein